MRNLTVYICDGSAKKRNMGAGIVRKKNNEAETFFFHKMAVDRWLDIHEHFAIEETLNLIEKLGDKEAIIYNDWWTLVNVINRNKPRKVSSNPILKETERELLLRIQKLKKDGYQLTFTSNIDDIKEELEVAHNLSRSYLKKQKQTNKTFENLYLML